MASPRDPKDPQSQHNEELNPFVAFRRFADEQMSSLLHNILCFPPSSRISSTPFSRYSDGENWQREAVERQRVREERDREDMIRDERIDEEAGEAMRVLGFVCPYRPDDQEVPLRNRAPRSSKSHPSKSLMGAPLFGYLLWSPYSPLHLEQDPVLRNHGDKWRRAFEDLTGTQIKGEMLDREILEKVPQRYWKTMLGGAFGGFESIAMPEEILDVAKAKGECWKDEFTELDLYERFLGNQDPQAASSSATSVPTYTTSRAAMPSTIAETPAPTVTSTLTTTERTTFPDGSVHTKVVLKKHFADGREESTETEHTSYSSQDESRGSVKPFLVGEGTDISKKEASEGIAQQAKKKGWFWS